jgi:hypothetical protein
MRLSNEIDQNFVKAAVPDGAAELLSFLPSLGTAETMVFGEAVNLPMRVILNTLAAEYRPHSSSAVFTDLWQRDTTSSAFMADVFKRWRARSLTVDGQNSPPVPAPAPAVKPTVQSLRSSMVKKSELQRAGVPPLAPPNKPQSVPTRPSQAQSGAISPQMRQRILEKASAKPQSLGDVKNMLNSAFNRDM